MIKIKLYGLASLLLVAVFVPVSWANAALADTALADKQNLADLYASPGPFQVKQELGVWQDAQRDNRQVPYKLYYPADRKDKTPIVVWSHGVFGSRESASYLGEHLASHGIAALHLQHPGTDASLIEPDTGKLGKLWAFMKMMRDKETFILRFADPRFVVDQLKQFAASGGGNGMLDTQRMGMAGHSLGAITTMAVAGQKFDSTAHFAIPEFKGAMVMSPSGKDPENKFDDMLMPIFHFTGTDDDSVARDFEPEDRKVIFDAIDDQDQYFLNLDKAVHMTFTGKQIEEDPYLDEHLKVIKMAAVSYWKMVLGQDQKAQVWLQSDGLANGLAAGDHFQFKARQLAEHQKDKHQP